MEAVPLPYEIHRHSLGTTTHHRKPAEFQELPDPDIFIVTSNGIRIPAHSSILASVSSVLENIIDQPRKHGSSEKVNIPILGVPCEAVASFVQFLYKSRCRKEYLQKYGIHLLALSHVYMVPNLKQRCSKSLAQQLTIDSVVDVLQLARMCDAPDLYLSCMKMVSNHFKSVEKTEGWKFLQENDPFLELQILQFMDESALRKKRCRRQRKEQKIYLELSEAMECLEHICNEGCTNVGPHDMKPDKDKKPCDKYSTCRGVQLLIKHFATCHDRNHGGCWRCKRMWQLLQLHASICDQFDHSCKVPLCRHFKSRIQEEKRKDDEKWKLLVRKVISARTISSVSLSKRKRDTMNSYQIKSFRLQSAQRYRS